MNQHRATLKVRVEMQHRKHPHAPFRITRVYRDKGHLYILKSIYGERFTEEQAADIIRAVASEPGYSDYELKVVA